MHSNVSSCPLNRPNTVTGYVNKPRSEVREKDKESWQSYQLRVRKARTPRVSSLPTEGLRSETKRAQLSTHRQTDIPPVSHNKPQSSTSHLISV